MKKLKVEGVRGFRGAHAFELDFTRPEGGYAGWTVIAGRNGSGKTTLLRTIALALAGPRRAYQLEERLDDHLSHGESQGAVEVTLIADPKADRGAPTSSNPLWAKVLWEPARESLGEGDVPRPEVRFQAPSQVNSLLWSSSPPTGWFHVGYGPFRRLAGTGLYERVPQSADRAAALRTLFEEQSALTESVDWLISLHLRQLEGEDAANKLLQSVRALLNDGLLPDGYQIHTVNSQGLWLRRVDDLGSEIALRRMSDGLRTVSALVLDIVRHMHAAYGTLHLQHDERGAPYLPHPGVALIDEVDVHLHVSWQQRIGEWFKNHFPAVQFVVTTHSPYICQAADPGGLILLPGPDDPEPPQVADEKLYGRVVYGTGDDAVLSELFGLDSPFSHKAEELREELADLEFAVATGQADEFSMRRYRELRRRLVTSQATRVEELGIRAGREEASDP
ncbi:AAA family ATPase [Nonomuraea sp. NPDC051941]|uniref:AAA family ATPase n=1 Tax=Nonomuraea sp. NPDC051941 TaxID=3364373 RepID=UPI0037CB3FD5